MEEALFEKNSPNQTLDLLLRRGGAVSYGQKDLTGCNK